MFSRSSEELATSFLKSPASELQQEAISQRDDVARLFVL